VGTSPPSIEPATPASENSLAAWEAALRLGITPELLFFYTSRGFQKRPGEKRGLLTHEVGGLTRFSVSELDAFDSYLREPWAEVGEARRDPPQKVLAYLHAESGGSCVRCGSGIAVETAHIEPWATSRCNHHHNLLRICSACHSEHDSHHSLSTDELRKLKAAAIERLRANLRGRLNLGTSLPAPAPAPLFVGRMEELSGIRDSLRTDRYLLVHGPGGIGKTQLVLRALQAADTGRPVLWVEAERYDSVQALRASLEVSLRSVHQADAEPLESVLDKMQACLVIDGLEQLKAPGIDEVDDWITQLQARLTGTQIIVTSQADLAQAQIDNHVRLKGIELEASEKILSHYLRPDTPTDASSLSELISFADGHPLTLRIEATLINYFGSSSIALSQIQLRGADLLEIQKRSSQNRLTSLKTCLSLAYDALTDDERKLLYVVANAPGGLFSRMFDHGQGWVSDGRSAIAASRRWGLIEVKEQGGTRERVHVLSPIASYAVARWREDRPDEARHLTKQLAKELALMAAVIEMHSEKNGGLPNMLGRFEEELPNLLRVLDLAEKELDDGELGVMATGICSALMRYFFVIQLGDIGSQVMMRGARIALREGRMKSASGLLTRMVGLAYRSQERIDIKPAFALIDEIELKAGDPETLGNVALCRAVAASLGEKHDVVSAQALAAIARFEEARASAKSADDEVDTESIENDLSSAYGLLGGALLAQRKYAAAANAYRKSLGLVRGQSVAVNEGQLHHQIGNCEACLGNRGEAASRYTEAARQFHMIGMRAYLGNALGEFGNLLLEIGPDGEWPTLPSIEIIEAGVVDVADTIEGCFGQYPFDLVACSGALRNLFGMTILIGFSNAVSPMAFPSTLQSALLPWAEQAVYDMDDIWVDELGGDAVHELKALLNLEATITQFEGSVRCQKSGQVDIAPLAAACARLGYWGGHHQKGRDWLFVYLARRWALPSGMLNDLKGRLARWNPEEPLLLHWREPSV